MKLNKIFNSIFAFGAALMMASCQSAAPYEPAPLPEGAQVFFPSTAETQYTADNSLTEIEIPVNRVDTKGGLQLTVKVEDESKLFFQSESVDVAFKEGEKEAALVIPVHYGSLAPGTTYPLTFTIADNTTPYAASSLTVKITVPEPWNYIGKAIMSEDILTTFFSVTAGTQWEVEAYTNSNYPGSYFFKNAFTSEYPYNDPGDYDDTMDHYFQIDSDEEGKVYVPLQYLGFDWGYGEFRVVSYISKYFSKVEPGANYGYIENNIIKFEPKTILLSMKDYKDEGLYESNGSGKFFIALPGAVLADYTTEVSYGGMVVDAEDNCSLVVNFDGAEDVASVQYGLSAKASAAEILEAIEAGEEAEDIVLGWVELNKLGHASVQISDLEPGVYTVVAVPVNAEEVPQPADAVSTKIKFSGLGPKEFEPKLGQYSYSDDYGTYRLTLATNPEDPTEYIIESPSGLPDESQWHLTLDEAARTLTCEGIELGYEQYGNQFEWGMVYGWYNKEKLYTYGYASFLESTDGDGNDPLIFNLDNEGYITGIENVMFGAAVYQSDEKGNPTKALGWGYLLTNEDELEYEGPAAGSIKVQNFVEERPIKEFSPKAVVKSKAAGKSKSNVKTLKVSASPIE